jgi:transcription elongation factor GreA
MSGFFVFIDNKLKQKNMAYMSQEGYDKLVAELQRLEAVERPKASAAIAEARDKGDLSENSEYDAAKEAQAHLEDKINKLKLTIASAKIVDVSRLSSEAVQILSKVELTNLGNNAKMVYTIVSEQEANLREGKISIQTPIAQGLLNKKVCDVVEIKVPRGTMQLRIDKISLE